MITVNFNKAFKSLQFISAGAVLLLFLSNFIWSYLYFTADKNSIQKVYVATDNGTMAASLAASSKPTIYEAKSHVKGFMQLMYSHDVNNFSERLNQALFLIDKEDGSRLYNDLKKGGILEYYTKFNARTEMHIDSVKVDVSIQPYKGVVYAKQSYLFDDERKLIPVAAKFDLIQTHRSDNNPSGLLLRNFVFIRYQP
jgi:hypothetical protein